MIVKIQTAQRLYPATQGSELGQEVFSAAQETVSRAPESCCSGRALSGKLPGTVSRYALESPVPPADLIALSPGYRVPLDLATVPFTLWHTRFALLEAATSD